MEITYIFQQELFEVLPSEINLKTLLLYDLPNLITSQVCAQSYINIRPEQKKNKIYELLLEKV